MKGRKFLDLAVLGLTMGLTTSFYVPTGKEKLNAIELKYYESLEGKAKEEFLLLDDIHREAAMSMTESHCAAVRVSKGVRERSVRAQYQKQIGAE